MQVSDLITKIQESNTMNFELFGQSLGKRESTSFRWINWPLYSFEKLQSLTHGNFFFPYIAVEDSKL